MKARYTAVLAIALAAWTACQSKGPDEERIRLASKGVGPVVVGVGWPFDSRKDHLMSGIRMAVEEVNAAGGVLGRELQVKPEDDGGSVKSSLMVAEKFANDPQLTAVIGHLQSFISLPASVMYEYHKILMITPASTSPRLTEQGYKLIFRNTPTDLLFGRLLAEHAKTKGYSRVMVINDRDAYGTGLANHFEIRADELGVTIVDRRAYDSANRKYFRMVLAEWKDLAFDAILVAGSANEAASFISEARQYGIEVPFLGGDGLDNSLMVQLGGDAVEGTVAASVFHADDPEPAVVAFSKAFMNKFGAKPDGKAAMGYDVVKLLAHAMEKAGTTLPTKVAEAMRNTQGWAGVTGMHNFNDHGDVTDKSMVLKIIRNGKFEFLTRVETGKEELE